MVFVIAVLLVLSMALLYLLYRSNQNKDQCTREQYAIRSLAAIVSLCTLGISTIASKQSIPDQIVYLIALISGHPTVKPAAAPVSEQILTVLLVGFACSLIARTHSQWGGLISTDEESRKRLQRPTNLFNQGIDEVSRIVKRRPKRKIYEVERRNDSVSAPDEPKIIWHVHAKELFELWYPSARFPESGMWNPRQRFWLGKDVTTKMPLILFCFHDKPDAEQIEEIRMFAKTNGAIRGIFAVYDSEISHQYLEGEITVISEEYLYENIVDFSDYVKDIIDRVEFQKFPNTELSMADIYTPSSISSDAAGLTLIADDLGAYLTTWSKAPPGKQLAIMGEYGQGKSTAALMYVYQSLKGDLKNCSNRVPLLIELRGKSPANLSPIELLAVWGQQYHINASALMKLQIAGRLTLIFEGFDEMANIASTEARISHFRALWRLAFSKSKIIFTGRRNLFFEEDEIQIVFKGASQENNSQLCELVHLCPFDSKKIFESLRWIKDDVERREIVAAANSSDQIREVVSRPSLLFIVATLWGDLRTSLMAGSLTSAQVIDRFIEHSYARQQVKEAGQKFMTLSSTERRYFHEGIAVFMAARGKTNQISAQDMETAIERLYTAYPENCHISNTIILESDRNPLKSRFDSKQDALEAINTDVRTHGILVNEVGVRSAFRFAHKSFYEVLAAKFQANLLLDIEPMIYQAIKSITDGNATPVREGNPEILNFFSQIFMHHLSQTTSNREELGLHAFDRLTGAKNSSRLHRFTIGIYFRFFNRKTLTKTIVAFSAITCISVFFAIFVMDKRVVTAKESQPSTFWPFFWGFLSALFFIALSRTGYAPQSVLSKIYLAAAVMVVDDKSKHSVEFQQLLSRIFGAKQSVQLSNQALEIYGLDYDKKS